MAATQAQGGSAAGGDDRALTRDLFAEWRSLNKAGALREQSLALTACMVATWPLDFLFFPPGLAIYGTLFRLIAIPVALLNLIAAARAPPPLWRLLAPWVLLPTPFLATLAPMLVVYWGPFEGRATTVILTFAPCFAYYVSAFTLFRYLRELAIFTLICLAANALMVVLNPAVTGEAAVFCFAVFGAGIVFLVRRMLFAGSLVEKYRNLQSLQPAIVARRLTVSDKRLADDEAFQARDRFTICLCSDWRGYQAMSAERSGETIARLFEVYYDIVFAELARAAPSGRYYADWTADEMLVIFYGDSDEERKAVMREALAFARMLASEIPERVKSEMGLTLKYDVGMAAGIGYLGLQGPSERRKTTIAGEVPGTAKRLETEAKELRARGFDSDYPNVVMDAAIGEAAAASGFFDSGWHSEFLAGTKNVEGMKVTLWRCMGEAQNTLLRLATGDRSPRPPVAAA